MHHPAPNCFSLESPESESLTVASHSPSRLASEVGRQASGQRDHARKSSTSIRMCKRRGCQYHEDPRP